MLKISQEKNQLLFQHEVLRARLDIRDFFLKTTVKEVYENIGQVLSLVRMQLAIMDPETNQMPVEKITSSGELVGQSIRDLRSMCRSFYPDHDILTPEGFIEGLIATLTILELDDEPKIKIKGAVQTLPQGIMLVAFKMIQEVLISILEIKGKFNSVTICYNSDDVTYTINYNGDNIDTTRKITNSDAVIQLSIEERIELVAGRLIKRKGKSAAKNILLQVPINVFV